MHCRSKEHLSKFNSKKEHIRKESAFIKHLENSHGGRSPEKTLSDYFDFEILKSYSKAFTKCVEEGTYISSHKGEVLNSKSECHQAKIVRTTTRVIQGGAEILRQQQGQAAGGGAGLRAEQGARPRAGQGAVLGAGQDSRQEAAVAEPRRTRRSRG